MRSFFITVLALFTNLYRLSNGKIMARVAGLNVLLLTTVGRKSGRSRTTPLGYFEHDGGYVITASNAGADRNPGWFFNLEANPNVRVRVKEKEFAAAAQVIESNVRNHLWEKLVRLSPQYGGYATSTKRVIPMVLLTPQQQ